MSVYQEFLPILIFIIVALLLAIAMALGGKFYLSLLASTGQIEKKTHHLSVASLNLKMHE